MPKRTKPQTDVEKVEALSPQQKVIFYLWCQGWTLRRIATQFGVKETSIQQQFLRIVHDKFEIEFFDVTERNRILKQRFCPEIAKLQKPSDLPKLLPAPVLDEAQGDTEPTIERELALILLKAEDDAIEKGQQPETALIPFRALIPRNPETTGIGPPAIIDVSSRPVRRGLPSVLTYILGVLTVAGLIGIALWQRWLPLTTPGAPIPVPQTVVVEKTVQVEKTVVVTGQPLSTNTPEPSQTPQSPLPTYTPFPTPIPQDAQVVTVPITIVVTATPPPPTATPEVSPTPTSTETPIPTATSVLISLPFSDTFDNGLDPIWVTESGDWNMQNLQLVNKSGAGSIWLGKQNWSDVVVELDVAGAGSWSCDANSLYIIVRMQDTANYIAAQVIGCNSETLYLVKDGKLVKHLVGIGQQRGRVRIEAVGKIYKVFNGGSLIASASDDTFTQGSVGISMIGQLPIDNFKVRAYSP